MYKLPGYLTFLILSNPNHPTTKREFVCLAIFFVVTRHEVALFPLITQNKTGL